MTTFQSFDSFDAMMDAMAEAEQAANDKLFAAQIALRDDIEQPRYWYRWADEIDLHIFGEAYSREQQHESDEATERWVDVRKRGYLYGKAFSVYEPDGELGDTHAATVLPITKAQFELARTQEWKVEQGDDLNVALALRVADMMLGKELNEA